MTSELDAGDWFICGRARGADGVSMVGFMVRGVLKAPVDDFCRRSNSSCSFGGSRGGAGPVEKAGLMGVVVKKRREGRRNFLGSRRDIVSYQLNSYCRSYRETLDVPMLDLYLCLRQLVTCGELRINSKSTVPTLHNLAQGGDLFRPRGVNALVHRTAIDLDSFKYFCIRPLA